MPTIVFSKSESEESGIKLEFLLSDYIERSNVSGWIEQENWFILNFYNIIKPDLNFLDNISSYPIQKIEKLSLIHI